MEGESEVMSERRNVLKIFEEKRDFMEDRIASGIERNRKGLARIEIVDEKGNPAKNVQIRVIQKTHDFKVGANLFMLDEFEHEERNVAYRELFADIFNIATVPIYWSDLEPEQGRPRFGKDSPKVYRRPPVDLCLEYCEKHLIEPKAHCLNYANFTPKWLPHDIAGQKYYLEKRFSELGERYSRRIPSWEVTNETFWDWQRFRDTFSFYHAPDFVDWSFATAARYFSNNRLIINEAGSRVWDGTFFYGTRSPYFMQIEQTIRNGGRIDSVGMQFHMFQRAEREVRDSRQFYDPERIYDVLDTYAKFGKQIQITEVTFPAYGYEEENEEIQAEILKNIYSIWFSHPAMEAIIYWNLVDGFAAFAPQGDMTAGENYFHGGLVRNDFTPKPSFHLVKELFDKIWRTNLELFMENGKVSFKGFFGDYKLEITVGGHQTTRLFHLGRETRAEWKIIL